MNLSVLLEEARLKASSATKMSKQKYFPICKYAAIIIFLIGLHCKEISCLRVKGTWESENFFLFLSKFGFQKTEIIDRNGTQGFVFGNITNPFYVASPPPPQQVIANSTNSSTNNNATTTRAKLGQQTAVEDEYSSYPGTLVVLDRGYFINFYRNRNIQDKNEACSQMFEQISAVNYHPKCNPEGKENFLRGVPCPKKGLCFEDSASSGVVVQDNQFTYAIADKTQAK